MEGYVTVRYGSAVPVRRVQLRHGMASCGSSGVYGQEG